MMKSKPYLKSLANPALLFSLVLLLAGCENQIPPTYQEKNIPFLIKQICKDEYKLDVTTKRVGSTLWIYAPMEKILHKEYGLSEDKIFDEEIMNKLRNILTTAGRVLISSDNTPDFFALLASDINIGLDYTIIGNTLDIKKSYAGFIPWTEANRRYVMRFKLSPESVGDTTGSHFEASDIKLPDFLAEQIAQRIGMQLQGENLKEYFKVEKSEGRFDKGTFMFEYAIQQIATPGKEIDMKKEILNIISYCLHTYEFKDFYMVGLKNSVTGDELTLNQAAIWEKPID